MCRIIDLLSYSTSSILFDVLFRRFVAMYVVVEKEGQRRALRI